MHPEQQRDSDDLARRGVLDDHHRCSVLDLIDVLDRPTRRIRG
jgi:hypothetical protein